MHGLAGLTALMAACGDGQTGDSLISPVACESFAGTTIAGAWVGTATTIASAGGAPEYCQITAIVAKSLVFQVRLPTSWNGKLHYSGGGGYGGTVPDANLPALAQGYVDVSSDSGHQGLPFDASFALNDYEKARLFGSLSVPTVMGPAKEIVRLHYGSPASRLYFEGCSGGGREALINAQRFPDLFDGVIARAPAYNWTAMNGAFNRNSKALSVSGARLTPGKVATLSKAVLAACDSADGAIDGIVSDVQSCVFNAAALRCTAGADTGDACLSDAQIQLVSSWTTEATFGGGAYRYPGWALTGNESALGAWDFWLLGTTSQSSLQFQLQDTTVKNYLARDPRANSLAYIFDSNPAALADLAMLNDATDPNLAPFAARNGKLLLWHGSSDPALSYKATVEYYQQMAAAVGGSAIADQFSRMYIAPGVTHCGGGPGADQADLLGALDAWVSQGRPPGDLVASRLDPTAGVPVMSRPLCRYPTYPRYTGSGDINAASSYSCVN